MGPHNPVKNPNRGYSADSPIHALVQGPAEDASQKQTKIDNDLMTSRERDYMGPNTPVKNPTRTYSADAGLHALVQQAPPAPEQTAPVQTETVTSRQDKFDNKALTLEEQGRVAAVIPMIPATQANPTRTYSATASLSEKKDTITVHTPEPSNSFA